MRSIADLLAKARSVKTLREVAECVALLKQRGLSQGQIARELGRSPAWMTRLLQWQRGGYIGDPFGAGHHTERVFTRAGEDHLSVEDRATIAAARAAARKEDRNFLFDELMKQMAARAKAQDELKRLKSEMRQGFSLSPAINPKAIDRESRDRLTKLLGMLGSNGDGEVDNAGRKADDLRRKLGMTWADLIIAAPDALAS
jgi:transposase-like protein